ncbi:MAG: YybH family protein [Terriglobia bacterium]
MVVLLLLAGLVGLGVACQPQPPDTRAADEQAIREADSKWSKATGAKDIEGFLSFLADDASLLPPNAPIATGKEAIREWGSGMMTNPGFAVSWQPTQVEVSRAGDLGYTLGTYELTLNDAEGNPVTERGKYVTVWKKQGDGSWKVVADIFNADQ